MPEQNKPGSGRPFRRRPATSGQPKSGLPARRTARSGPKGQAGPRRNRPFPQSAGQPRPGRQPQAETEDTRPPQATASPIVELEPNYEKPDYLVIAQIAAPFGLRGAVKANVTTDFLDRFDRLKEVYLAPPNAPPGAPREKRELLSARLQNEKQVVFRFAGLSKVEQAEGLRGYSVAVPVAEAVALPEGEFYVYQIIGLEVYSLDEQYIGRVVNVERLPASDVYVVRGPLSKKDVLLPAVRDIVKDINLDTGRITVDLLEGLI